MVLFLCLYAITFWPSAYALWSSEVRLRPERTRIPSEPLAYQTWRCSLLWRSHCNNNALHPFERPVIVCIAICGGIRGRRNDWVSHQGVPFWCLRLDDTVCVENQVIEYQLTVFIRCLRFQIFPFCRCLCPLISQRELCSGESVDIATLFIDGNRTAVICLLFLYIYVKYLVLLYVQEDKALLLNMITNSCVGFCIFIYFLRKSFCVVFYNKNANNAWQKQYGMLLWHHKEIRSVLQCFFAQCEGVA